MAVRWSFAPPRKRPLATAEALYCEARRLGFIAIHRTQEGDSELQQRALKCISRTKKNYVQTFAILVSVILTTTISVLNTASLRTKESADVMFEFNQIIMFCKSWTITRALDLSGNLDESDVDDDMIEQFVNNYELLAAAYLDRSRHGS